MMGLKGSGKTKQLIEMVRNADEEEKGSVVCIEKGPKLTHDIPHTVRLIETSHFTLGSFDFMKGLICGVFSANYDTTHIFIDSLLKIIGIDVGDDISEIEDFLDWCEDFSNRENVKFTLTISADVALATEKIKKYF
jgi:hypothetical protein